MVLGESPSGQVGQACEKHVNAKEKRWPAEGTCRLARSCWGLFSGDTGSQIETARSATPASPGNLLEM